MVLVGASYCGGAGMSWMSMSEARKYLHIGQEVLIGGIKSGGLHAYRVPTGSADTSARCLLSSDDLDAWVRSWPEWDERTQLGVRRDGRR